MPDLSVEALAISKDKRGAVLPGVTSQLAHRGHICRLFCIAVKREALRYLPDENLAIIGSRSDNSIIERVPRCRISPAAYRAPVCKQAYQSVSKTGAVCPRNRGICSGSLPFSLIGITANAPPPLASQLTEMYSGFACMPSAPTPACSGPRSPDLHQVRIPGIATDMQVIIGSLLLCGLPENMSYIRQPDVVCPRRSSQCSSLRYFDARTKRPAIRA
jgi:hypothetical protein